MCEQDDNFRRLRVGILAVLGRSRDELSHGHLRKIYREEPEMRAPVAMALSQYPHGENWKYLIDSLKTVEGTVAREILVSLTKASERPQDHQPVRQVILQGLKLEDQGAQYALALLNHWSGRNRDQTTEDWQSQIQSWQQWYARHFPDAPPAELPADSGTDKWTYEELLNYLTSSAALRADSSSGKEAFRLAECIKCHRCGTNGETLGPDLTNLAYRFQKKEILEAIVYPSHNISDQYSSQVVHSGGRTYVGLVVPRGESAVTVLLSDGQKVEVERTEIESIQPSQVSAMPTGLLNKLTLQQVADLFAYLERGEHTALASENKPTTR